VNDDLRKILEELRQGEIDVDAAISKIQPSADLGFAKVDLDRERRCGFPEVVFCDGKTADQATAITQAVLQRSDRVLLTRADPKHAAAVAAVCGDAHYHELARAIVIDPAPRDKTGHVALVAAGTSDLPVAIEAELTAQIMGAHTTTHWDVGVAGLHRLLAEVPEIRAARVVVAIAGMEGALASVVTGLVDQPVVAVPTSVGYGLNLDGITPLLSMLNSCASGVGVVNVDNGFGGGYLAALINRVSDHPPRSQPD